MSLWPFALLFLSCITIGNALECYVCQEQADNANKCGKTIATCEQDQDVCMTKVRWGSAPYWTEGGKKQHFISKTCSTKKECQTTKRENMKYCTHLWYEDWTCYDCCVGDRCNYFIFSKSNKHGTSSVILLVTLLAPMLVAWVIQ